jgi:transposase
VGDFGAARSRRQARRSACPPFAPPIVNAILYQARNGGVWRALPHDLPPWETVYGYYRQWSRDGAWQTIHDHLRGVLRESMGKETEPSAAILDSQSVKTAEKGASYPPR